MTAHCIITSEVSEYALQIELGHLVDYFSDRELTRCKVLFGFAWGNEYYSGDWLEEEIPLSSLLERVATVEKAGLGRLGRDDLHVTVSGLEFQFCHESDLHLGFSQATDDVEHFYNRWGEQGYSPAEWIRDANGAPKVKVRARGA